MVLLVSPTPLLNHYSAAFARIKAFSAAAASRGLFRTALSILKAHSTSLRTAFMLASDAIPLAPLSLAC
eukprot:6197322-Pleurochrysis_carterae.AAC.2